MMKKTNLFFAMLIAAASLQSCGNSDQSNSDSVEVAKDVNEDNKQIPEKASEFMVKAASGGMMEVQLGKMAQSKTVNERVKAFGAMLERDHTAANEEMKTLAGSKSVVLPSSLGEDHQKHVNDLNEKTGADFDKEYISMMVDDHKKDISDFEDAAKSDDADLKAFAEKTLPVLRMHLDSANAIHDAIK